MYWQLRICDPLKLLKTKDYKPSTDGMGRPIPVTPLRGGRGVQDSVSEIAEM